MKLNFKYIIFFLFLTIFLASFLESCSTILEKPVYIKSKYPVLKEYPVNKTLTLKVYNKDNKICVENWKTCIPKTEFFKLANFIELYKKQLKKANQEIKLYNKFFDKNRSEIKNKNKNTKK